MSDDYRHYQDLLGLSPEMVPALPGDVCQNGNMLEAVKADVANLQKQYDQAIDDLRNTWRKQAMTVNARRRAKLEVKESELYNRVRLLTIAQARAQKALEQLENESEQTSIEF